MKWIVKVARKKSVDANKTNLTLNILSVASRSRKYLELVHDPHFVIFALNFCVRLMDC